MKIVTKFHKADSGQIHPAAFKLLKSKVGFQSTLRLHRAPQIWTGAFTTCMALSGLGNMREMLHAQVALPLLTSLIKTCCPADAAPEADVAPEAAQKTSSKQQPAGSNKRATKPQAKSRLSGPGAAKSAAKRPSKRAKVQPEGLSDAPASPLKPSSSRKTQQGCRCGPAEL